MKKFVSILMAFFIFATMFASVSFADNPVVQTIYTADPAPMVYNDTMYLYTGRDEDKSTFFTMKEWRVYSSTDMVNWTDQGSPLDLTAFSWAKADAWAGQVIPRNGKFYFYTTMSQKNGGGYAIGVAVSDSPTGPFTDALGKPLVANNGARAIDPTVFIDDDGQAYLYWGNSNLWYVKLNEDMISYSGSISQVDLTIGFGGTGGSTLYEEGPWLHKHNGLYYMVYAAGGIPEYIAYSTSTSPTGPWTYRGVIMPNQGASFTNHPGVIDYKGNSYFVYHNGALPGGGGYARSVAIEKFNYNADGTIPTMNMTTTGAPQISNLNPYVRNEAETIAWESGIKTETCRECSQGGLDVYSVDNGDYIKVSGVDFGSTGAGTFTASVASGTSGGTIELHLDTVNGTLIGTLPISNTGGENSWKTKTTNISDATGVHNVYIVFKGASTGNLFKIDYWQFGKKSADHDLAAINASIDKQKIDIVSGTNTATMKVRAIYADGTSEDVTAQATATPAQSGIVSVSGGVVTGVGYGSTNISIGYRGKTDVLHIDVNDLYAEQAVKGLIVDKSSVTLNAGRTAAFKITAEYFDGHTEDVTNKATYTNPHTDIATVANGTITAKASGTTDVVFSFKGTMGDAVTAQMNIAVNDPVTEPVIEINGVLAIEAETAAENSANAYVNGTISGHTWSLVDGQSTKAMFFGPKDGFSASATDAASLAANSRLGYKINFTNAGTYNVWLLVKTLGYDSDSVHVGLDNQYKFTTNGIEGVSGGQYKWANISGSSGGMFGGATLNVTAGVHELNFWGRENGFAIDRIYLTKSNATTDPVWPVSSVAVTGVTLDKGTLSLAAGATGILTATVNPADATNKAVTFTSSNTGVATVNGATYNPLTGTTSITVNAIAAGNTVITATTTEGSKTAVSNVTVVPQVPTTVLSAASSVNPGSSFTVAVSLDNVTQSVYAQDITLSYDSNVFDYVSSASANNNIQLVSEDKSTAGKVRLITANTGGGISGASTLVLNLTFKVKAGVQNTSGTIAAIQARLGVIPEGTVIEAALSSKSISVGNIVVAIDKTVLTTVVASAQSLYDGAVVGTAAGQYPQAAKDAFGVALNAATAVKDNQSATQSQVDNAVTALNNASVTFRAAVMKSADITNNGSIDVGDLAIVAYYYGKNSNSTDWSAAKIADMNNDNKIDISDLAYVASKILQ